MFSLESHFMKSKWEKPLIELHSADYGLLLVILDLYLDYQSTTTKTKEVKAERGEKDELKLVEQCY